MIGRSRRNVLVCALAFEREIDNDLTCDGSDVDNPEGCTFGCPLLIQTTDMPIKLNNSVVDRDANLCCANAWFPAQFLLHIVLDRFCCFHSDTFLLVGYQLCIVILTQDRA